MSFVIGVDFDGTLVEHHFPDIRKEVVGAFYWLKQFQDAGAKLILWTMRSDLISDGVSCEGHAATEPYLSLAVEYSRDRGIEFWGVNKNPEQGSWTTSPKPYCHVYIDDAAINCPLREAFLSRRPMVDWSVVGPMVMEIIKSHGGDK